jgi:hypothetical protein
MVGSRVGAITGHWQWGIRVTPLLAIVCLLLLYFVLQEPSRGAAEHAHFEQTSLLEDLKYLRKMYDATFIM